MMEKKNNFTTAAGVSMLAIWLAAIVVVFFSEQAVVAEREKIPYKIVSRRSYVVKDGWQIWLKEGEPGYRGAVSKVVRLFGKTVKREKFFETGVIKKPKEGFVIKGRADKNNPVTVPKVTYAHYIHDMEATAYDPSPESNGIKWAGITKLGWRTRYGICAVDPKVIPLRSLIYVDGYGFAWAGDVGGAIKGKKIDLCYNTTEEAFKWGRKKVKVYVLGNKPPSYYAEKKKAKAAQAKAN
jgi:3D (Asp-Asp-Asp) domain-containing protein